MKFISKKERFLKIYKKLLGKFPSKVPFLTRIIERKEYDDYIREKVIFQSEIKESIFAYFLIPKKSYYQEGLPVVICLHQHGGHFALGKSEIVGRIGNKNQQYGLELVKRGYAVFAADSRCFEERQKFWDGDGIYSHRLLLEGKTLAGMFIWDIKRAIDWLESRKEINPNRIGLIGHSMGAMQALILTPLEKRIKVVMASCGAKVLKIAFLRGDDIPWSYQIPGFMKTGDLPLLYSMIAPKPFLLLGRSSDKVSTLEEQKVVKKEVMKIYKCLGKEECFSYYLEDGGHAFSFTMRERAYKWLKKWL
ncbi:MAG: alpha/beta fold hydrolase [Candidatus Firestonebacteria bacterium]